MEMKTKAEILPITSSQTYLDKNQAGKQSSKEGKGG